MKKLQVIFGAISLLTLSAANAGTLVLDSYNYAPPLDLEASPSDTVVSDTVVSTESGANALYTLTWLSGPAVDTAKGNAFGSGVLAYGEEPDADGKLEIAYSIDGGGTLDFTGYTDFYFDVSFIDGSGGFDTLLTLVDFDGTTISTTFNVSTVGRYLTAFSSLSPGPDFDFSQVLTLNALITSDGLSDDFTLDEVGLVPEPSALAVLGLGLIGLGLRRRKLA